MKTQKQINMTLKVALLNFEFLQGTREQLLPKHVSANISMSKNHFNLCKLALVTLYIVGKLNINKQLKTLLGTL